MRHWKSTSNLSLLPGLPLTSIIEAFFCATLKDRYFTVLSIAGGSFFNLYYKFNGKVTDL